MNKVTLYGIVENRDGTLKIESVEAIERAKTYLLKGRPQWLGFNRTIKRDNPLAHLSALSAIESKIRTNARLIAEAEAEIKERAERIGKLAALKAALMAESKGAEAASDDSH